MIKLALTGSIGMGKSTVATMFADAGIPVFDADAEVRLMQGYGGDLVDAIEERFPGTTREGAVDRDLLSARVLGDRDQLAALETIVHPAVAEKRRRFLERHEHADAVLFDIPLLYETGGEADYDKIIVVTAPEDIQRARVLERKGMTESKLESILARQLPDSVKRRRADFVIDNGGPLSETKAQVDEILACLGLSEARK